VRWPHRYPTSGAESFPPENNAANFIESDNNFILLKLTMGFFRKSIKINTKGLNNFINITENVIDVINSITEIIKY
jgi:hypothetical protein